MSTVRDFYRSSAEYGRMLDEQDKRVFEPYVELFRSHAPAGGLVIDVGCGVGTSTRLLRAAGFRAVGTDISERYLPGEEGFLVADFQSAPQIPADTYDAAGALNVLEHAERPQRLLAEMVRVVRPGGRVIVLSPNLTSPLMGVRILRDHIRRGTPYLGVRTPREALGLIVVNLARSVAAALGRDAFASRAPRLNSGIVGYDVDAVYWTNAAEVRRFLESSGCRTVVYQGAGRTRAARLVARRLPSFAGRLQLVVEKI
jgi:SAM-dependent methyltransferase